MIEEGILFPPEGYVAPYFTVSEIPVFYAPAGDVATFRTLFGVPGIWTVLGGDFDAFPAHTTDTIFTLSGRITAMNSRLQHNSLAFNESIKYSSRGVNGILQ